MTGSPVTPITFGDYELFVKRDDLLHPHINGNKARKLHYFLHTPLPITTIVSYGSIQSNAMAALAYLAHLRGWRFVYYTRINQELLRSPAGNLAYALSWGMELHDIAQWPYADLDLQLLSRSVLVDGTLIVPEGVRCQEAYAGIAQLAEEIVQWSRQTGLVLPVFLPSGTGTTALWLQQALRQMEYGAPLFTVACVGGSGYLQQQFRALQIDASLHPHILEPPRRYRFARLYPELYEVWQEVRSSSGITFDLLYDPVAFMTLKHTSGLPKRLLYIHQGGLLGNQTMEERYKKKFATIKKKL